MMHVAIVGAGWSGLAAATDLAQRGIRVTVFEASRSLGGRARRVVLDGNAVDNGQHILIGAYRDTLTMMRKVGADPDQMLSRLPLALQYADGFRLRAPGLPAPLHLAMALITARRLTWSDRFHAMRLMAALQVAQFRVEPDIAVTELLARHKQSPALCSHVWNPLCVSALNTPAHSASASCFAAVLRDSLAGPRHHSDMLIPKVDLSALFPEPAARFITRCGGDVRLGRPVRRITPIAASTDRAESGTGLRLDDDQQPYSHVIIAVAPQHAAALLAGDARLAPQRAIIDALKYQPIVTCYLQYPASVRLPLPMLGFTGKLVQWLFDRGQLGGDKGLLAAVISAEGAHLELNRDDLAQRVHVEIGGGMPGSGNLPEPTWSRVVTEKRATFACTAGLQRPAAKTPVPGLLLAGDYIAGEYPGTLETAVRQGLAAAALVRS